MSQSNINELAKVERLLDKIEAEMKKKRTENLFSSPEKFVNYTNKTNELYSLISDEVLYFLEIIGLSDYISTFKKLFRGLQHQIHSMLKFTLYYYNTRHLQVKEAESIAKSKNTENNASVTSKFQRGARQDQNDRGERAATIGPINPHHPNHNTGKGADVGPAPSYVLTDEKARPSSGANKNSRSSCPPGRRNSNTFHMASEQENAFDLEVYKKETEKIQVEIDGLLESKDSILKIQPTTLANNLKQVLKSLESTKKRTKIVDDESSEDDVEDEVDFEKMVKKLMEACGAAQKKMFQKIVDYIETKKLAEGRANMNDQETMPDPKMLEIDEKHLKKELENMLALKEKDLEMLKDRIGIMHQDHLFIEEKYTSLLTKHSHCEEDKKIDGAKLVVLEEEVAVLRRLVEEGKQEKLVREASFRKKEASGSMTPTLSKEDHEKLMEELKDYRAQVEKLRAELKKSRKSTYTPQLNGSFYSASQPHSAIQSAMHTAKHGDIASPDKTHEEIRSEDEDEITNPNKSFNKGDLYDDIEDITERNSSTQQRGYKERQDSLTHSRKSSASGGHEPIKSIVIAPGMNAPRKAKHSIDEKGQESVEKVEKVERVERARVKTNQHQQQQPNQENSKASEDNGEKILDFIDESGLEAKPKTNKKSIKALYVETPNNKMNDIEDDQTVTLKKYKSPVEKSAEKQRYKESSPKRRQTRQIEAKEEKEGSPKHGQEEEREEQKKILRKTGSRRVSPTQEKSLTKPVIARGGSIDIGESGPRSPIHNMHKKVISPQSTKSILGEESWAGQQDMKSPQIGKKRVINEEEKKLLAKDNEEKSLAQDEKSRGKYRSVDKAVQTDDELLRTTKTHMRHNSNGLKVETRDHIPQHNQTFTSIGHQQCLTSNTLSNKSLNKLMREAKEVREAQMVRIGSGTKLPGSPLISRMSGAAADSTSKIREQVRKSLLTNFDIKHNLQALTYDNIDMSNQLSSRLKDRMQTDLADQSMEKLDGDLMSPAYNSGKGEDTRVKFLTPLEREPYERNKFRSSSTFTPAKLGDEIPSPHVDYDDTQMTVMYSAMLIKADQDPKILQFLKNFQKERGEIIDDETFVPHFDAFVDFIKDLRKKHKKCGENCHHLQRFYSRIGYYNVWNKRSPLTMKKPSLVSNNNNNSKVKSSMRLPNIPEKKILKMAIV